MGPPWPQSSREKLSSGAPAPGDSRLSPRSALGMLPPLFCLRQSPLPSCLPLGRTLAGFGAPQVTQDASAPGDRKLPMPAGPLCVSRIPLSSFGL